MKIFGISLVTLLWAIVLMYVGFKFWTKIPLLNKIG